ncbi:MAG: GNAT family N-acetyltransferase [Sedimenticola sp.]
MTNFRNLVIAPLNSTHDRQAFTCGVESLDRYLKKQARQDVKRRISSVFVATTAGAPTTVVGYYTLSTLSIELTRLPSDLARKLPRHPIPAALIGRLACLKQAQGNPIGKMLLMDALKRTLAVSSEIAIYAMVVDAIDDQAARFYQQYGFAQLTSEDRRLFLPLRSV